MAGRKRLASGSSSKWLPSLQMPCMADSLSRSAGLTRGFPGDYTGLSLSFPASGQTDNLAACNDLPPARADEPAARPLDRAAPDRARPGRPGAGAEPPSALRAAGPGHERRLASGRAGAPPRPPPGGRASPGGRTEPGRLPRPPLAASRALAAARPPHGPLPGADRAAPGQPEPGGAAGAGERLLGARPGEALRLLAPGGRRQLAADRTAAPRPLGAGQPRQRGGALRDPAAPRRAARRAGARGRPGQPQGGTATAGPLPTGTHPGAGARPLPPSHPDRGGSQESRGARGDRGAGRRGAPLGTAPAAPGAALRPRDRLQHDLPGAALHGRPAAPALEPALRRRRRAWPGAGQGPGRRPYPGLRALPPQPHRLPAALLRALPGRPDAAAYRRRAQPRHAAGRPAAAPRRRLLPAPQLPGQPPLRHGVQRVPPPPDRPWPPPGVFHRGGPLAQRAHAAGAARHARHDPPLLPAQQRRRPPPAPGLHSGAYRLRADHRERQLPAR